MDRGHGGRVFGAAPVLRQILLVAGALYLAWLGGGLIRRSRGGDFGDAGTGIQALPSTALGVAVFQILNPKSWVLVTTATVAMPGGGVGAAGLAGFGGLAAMMIVIPGLCRLLWACAGAAIADWLRRPGGPASVRPNHGHPADRRGASAVGRTRYGPADRIGPDYRDSLTGFSPILSP